MSKLPVLSLEESAELFKMARIMALKVVGRYYPELLDDAIQEAVIRAWDTRQKGHSIKAQAWAAKNGALELLRSRIGKDGKKSNLYHTESFETPGNTGSPNNLGEVRAMDTRSEFGAPDPNIEALLRYGVASETIKLLVRWVSDRRRRRVLELYYGENPLTFKQIGQRLDVSESRIYQFHLEGTRHLKEVLLPLLIKVDNLDDLFDYLAHCRRCWRCKIIKHSDQFSRTGRVACEVCQKKRRERRNSMQNVRRNSGKPIKVLSNETHVCRICERRRSTSYFQYKRDRKNGLCSYCDECYSCIRMTDPGKPRMSYTRRIPLLRAAWRVAWELGIAEGRHEVSQSQGSHLKITSLDRVRTTPGMNHLLKEAFPAIPGRFVDLWLETPPNDANPKEWAQELGCHPDTVRRWRNRVYTWGQEYLVGNHRT